MQLNTLHHTKERKLYWLPSISKLACINKSAFLEAYKYLDCNESNLLQVFLVLRFIFLWVIPKQYETNRNYLTSGQ